MKIRYFIVMLFLVVGSAFATTKNNYIPMQDIGRGTYYVNVALANLSNSQFMVDTGSGYVAINQESLSKLRENDQASYVRDIQGILANGKTYVVQIWQVSSITLNDKCTLRNIEVAVFPGKTRQILGLSALKKAAPLQISFDPPQLVLSHCDV